MPQDRKANCPTVSSSLPWINLSVLPADLSAPPLLSRHYFKQLYWFNSPVAVNHSLVIWLPVIHTQRSGRRRLNCIQTEKWEGTDSPYLPEAWWKQELARLLQITWSHIPRPEGLGGWHFYTFAEKRTRMPWTVVRGGVSRPVPLGNQIEKDFLLGLERFHGGQIK